MKLVVSVLVLLALAVGVYYIADRYTPEEIPETPTTQNELETYDSDMLGFSFSYPSKYFLVERDLSTGERERHSITLIEDTPANRALVAGEVEGAEGPTAITVDIFQNDLDNYTAESFAESTNDSNFKLSPDGVLTDTELSGEPAVGYRWSGLYEGQSVVVARPNWVYMFSVTYLTPQDDIIPDFGDVLEHVYFDDLAEEGEI